MFRNYRQQSSRELCRGGITLIDLVVTILIIAITAATAAPRMTEALSAYRVRTAAEHVAADLNYARRYARITSSNCTASFTLDPPSYVLSGVPASNHSGADQAANLDDLGYGISFTTADFDGEAMVMFNQYGRPIVPSTGAPLASGVITVQSGNASQNIVIDAATGKASLP